MIHTGVIAYVQRWLPRSVERPPQPPITKLVPIPLRLTVSQIDRGTPTTVIHLNGPLDRRTVATLVDCAAHLYADGVRSLLIDLRGAHRIELSGLFALHSIARLYRGDPLPDPEDGWAVLHEAAQVAPAAHGEGVKLVASPTIARVISQSKVCQLLVVYDDQDSAASAFPKQ